MCVCATNLVLLALLSFSIHYTRSAILVLCVYLLSAKQLTVTSYSYLLSLNYVPSILVPIIIGVYLHREVDKTKRFFVLLIALFLIIITSLSLSISMNHERFIPLILSMFIFSSASSVVILIQRALTLENLSQGISYTSTSASTGITIAIGNIAKLLGKLTVVVLLELSSIDDVVLVVIIISLISFFSGIFLYNLDIASRIKRSQENNGEVDDNAAIMLSLISPNFYSYALIHSIVLSTFHLFNNSIPVLMVKNHNFSLLSTAIYGSLVSIVPSFTSPVIGYIMKNHSSYHLESCIIVAAFTYAGYLYLIAIDGRGYINPVVNVLVLSVMQSFLATITLSCSLDNLCIEKRYNNLFYTYAFAIMESLYSIMSVILTAIFGFLSSSNVATDDTVGGVVNASSLSIILYSYALIAGLLLTLKVLQKYNSNFVYDQYMQIL